MRNWLNDTQYALAQSGSDVILLRDLRIPPPIQAPIGYAKHITRADGSRVPSGYLQCTWIWDSLSRESLRTLLHSVGVVNENVSYKLVYLQTDFRNGLQTLPDFRLYTAVMYVPTLDGKEGLNVPQSPYAMQSVKLFFNKLQEVV